MAIGKFTIAKLIGAELNFQFADDGLGTFKKELSHYRTRATDLSPVFEAFDPFFKSAIQQNFQTQGRPKGWASLAESTQDDRERKGFPRSRPILVRTGKMQRNFRSRIGKRSYAMYNRMFYFPFNQFGSEKNNLPARPMIVFLKGHKSMFTELARKHMLDD